MKIRTFQKRFELTDSIFEKLEYAMIIGKNGKMYEISLDKNKNPIAKLLKR